jgi:hypothetical protein
LASVLATSASVSRPLATESLQRVEDAGLRLGGTAGRGVEQQRLHATLRRHLRDAAPHRAGADHAHREIGAIDVESHCSSNSVIPSAARDP